MSETLIRLQCGCNSYEWGKIGQESAAARFAAATPNDNFSVQDGKPYAELWMGTHPSNPSKNLATKKTLLEIVQNDKKLMSEEISNKYQNKLPFLFKVLSINKALSIQAHPNKKLAERLHAKDPKNYPDDNHKPEMTIAVTSFDGLCGFRPLEEISHFLDNVPSFRALLGEDQAKSFQSAIKGKENDESCQASNKKALQAAFTKLMNVDSKEISKQAKILLQQAKEEGEKFAGDGGPSNDGKELSDLMIRLNDQFPEDIGLFVSFFLNYVQLDVGEAMFLKADDIHAYLSGDIIECMASSDNVVRAGFTPKFKDINTLTEMLTYSYAPISEQKMDPTDFPYVKFNSTAYLCGSSAILYNPPIEEFSVVKTDLYKTGSKATFESVDGPTIIICTSGKGKISVDGKDEDFEEGWVYFIAAGVGCILENTSEDNFTTFKAFCELEDESK